MRSRYYKVFRTGYDNFTWEPVENLDNCGRLLREYDENQKLKKRKGSSMAKRVQNLISVFFWGFMVNLYCYWRETIDNGAPDNTTSIH